MTEVNGFEVVNTSCGGGCDRVIDMIRGSDDELYCPICDRSHVQYMVGVQWCVDAIRSSQKLSDLSYEDWEWLRSQEDNKDA